MNEDEDKEQRIEGRNGRGDQMIGGEEDGMIDQKKGEKMGRMRTEEEGKRRKREGKIGKRKRRRLEEEREG